jgi:signal transduction histidine kinase
MLKKLEHAFQQQERFMANAAHEFRTPLTILKTNLEVLRSDPSATLADYRQLSDIFEKTLKRMNHMVNELLVLAKNNDPDKDVIEAGSLIRKVVSELNDLASTQTISIETHIHPDVKIYGNDTLIQRAISNLVENAIMYNKPQGKVIITCTSQEGECFISIMDTGDGIDEKHIPFIFEPFYRTSEGRTKNKAGTGLGLSIALSIIKKHEGTIEYSREQTMKGFIVRLPVID